MGIRLLTAALFAALLVASSEGAAPRHSSAHSPHAALDFSMEVDIDGDTVGDCSTDAGQSTSCVVALNAPFRVREYLNSQGDIPSYRGMQLHFGFSSSISPASDPDSVWPGCAVESFYFLDGFGHAACTVLGTSPSIAYTGLAGLIFFECSADGAIDLMHGIDVMVHTHLTETGLTRHAEDEQSSEVVSITCTQPAPYPADRDSDGCPDEREASEDEQDGGRRNFFGEWDYFNPTGDRLNRVDDILAVVMQYFIDEGDPEYSSGTDRTAFGPDAWNLGPPNGQQRVDDILGAVKSYFHDCA